MAGAFGAGFAGASIVFFAAVLATGFFAIGDLAFDVVVAAVATAVALATSIAVPVTRAAVSKPTVAELETGRLPASRGSTFS